MKKSKFLKGVFIGIILIFLFSYFLEYSGYYEYNLHSKKNLTAEAMQQFEEAVKNGEKIDLNSYLMESTVDYSNSLTRTASQANLKLNEYLKKILTGGFDMLGRFIK